MGYYPYPAAAGPPTSVRVIGIVGTALAGLSLAVNGFGLRAIAVNPRAYLGYGAYFRTVRLCQATVFGIAAAVLMTASVGCLVRAAWGRRAMLVWAVAYPAVLVIDACMMVGWVVPDLMAPRYARLAGGAAHVAGLYGGVVTACLALLVLPAFTLVYLRRPAARAAFGPASR